jgi:hypothetical protein
VTHSPPCIKKRLEGKRIKIRKWIKKESNAPIFTLPVKMKVLTAEKAFLALALYNTVRLSMTLFFPFAISMIGECRASVDRVADFLLLEERDARLITRTFHPKNQEVTALYI